jgi:ankyrin repeat protein
MVLIQFLIRCATYAAGNVLRQAQEAHRERGAGQQNIGAVGGAGQSTPPVRPTVTASTAAAPTPTGQADTDHRLRAAIAGGDGAKIMEALLRGEDVNTDRPGGMDYAGLTPLDVAAHLGDEDLCRRLLKAGADPRLPGHLPLALAAAGGHEAVCRLLLQHSVDVDSQVGPGFSALMAAIEEGKTSVVNLLLDAGADPNATRDALAGDGGRLTCLMAAAASGHADICRALLDRGAAIDTRGFYGLTALCLAAHGGSLDACRVLLDAGADVNARDDEGGTPLTLAAVGGFALVCGLLLERGADAEARDHTGRTTLEIARDRNDYDTQFLLIGMRPESPQFDEGRSDEGRSDEDRSDEGREGRLASCPGCGVSVAGDAAFCSRCGLALKGSSRSSPHPTPPLSSPHPTPDPYPTPGPSASILGGLSHVDYSAVFSRFDAAGGKWVPTFNLLAFLIGPFWYLLKGMWPKAILLGLVGLFLAVVTGGVAAVIPWLYYGFFANWDLYLWERRGNQWW